MNFVCDLLRHTQIQKASAFWAVLRSGRIRTLVKRGAICTVLTTMMLPLSYRSVWGLKGHLRAAEQGAAGNFQMQNSCTLLLRDLYLHIAQPVIVPLSIMEA